MKTDGRHISLIQERISALHLADIFLFMRTVIKTVPSFQTYLFSE